MVVYKDIFEAVSKKDLAAVELLIEEEGVDLDERNNEGDTVAHVAAKSYDLEILQYLLKKNPTLLSKRGKYDYTLLEIAIGMYSKEMVKFLVDDCKANIYDQADSEHPGTYVHLSAEVCSLEIFKYFIEKKKIDVNLKNKWHQPLAFSAARGACLDIIKYIVEVCRGYVTGNDVMGRNILCQSALGCDLTVPRYLLDERRLTIDTNNTFIIQDALTYAEKFKSNKIEEFVEYFVEKKRMNINNGENSFPLHTAVEIGTVSMVKYLVQHGADITRKNLDGKTPLQVATNEDVIKYLEEMEHRRPRRSLPAVSKYDANFRVLKGTHVSRASLLLDHSENVNWQRFTNTSPHEIQNILALANAYVVSKLYAQPPLLSPKETIQNRMDPVAINAIHNYLS